MPFYWTPESLQANSIIPKSCFVFFNSGGVVVGGLPAESLFIYRCEAGDSACVGSPLVRAKQTSTRLFLARGSMQMRPSDLHTCFACVITSVA